MDIIIVGCGRVGSKFASIISDEGHNIVVVDENKRSFTKLDSSFGGVLVTGNPIDQEVLKNAGIESADALMAMTADDNINIMVCQIAVEKFSVPKVIARIFDSHKEKLYSEYGLETICPTDITIEVMKTRLLGTATISRHSIGNETIELSYEKASKKNHGKKTTDIACEDELMLFGILRNDEMRFAKPDYVIEKDDIIIWAKKQAGEGI